MGHIPPAYDPLAIERKDVPMETIRPLKHIDGISIAEIRMLIGGIVENCSQQKGVDEGCWISIASSKGALLLNEVVGFPDPGVIDPEDPTKKPNLERLRMDCEGRIEFLVKNPGTSPVNGAVRTKHLLVAISGFDSEEKNTAISLLFSYNIGWIDEEIVARMKNSLYDRLCELAGKNLQAA